MLNIGTVLQNRYQILQRIGGGGMGDVYLAYDLRLGNQQVVVKENRGGDPQLFYSEAAILATLRHPNLPRVIDHFVEPSSSVGTGAQYLVMDYIAWQNLEQIVQARGALTEHDALAWMLQILDAVRYLHVNRIIHRDIKPQNIIITPDGRAMLVDFGIAKVMGQGTQTGARGFCSPGYASPEHYTGGTDERSDVYALGATLYFALTGAEPPSVPERAGGVPLASIRQRNASASAKTENAVVRAMELRKDQRFQNAPEMEWAMRAMVAPTTRASATPNQLLVGIGVAIGALVLFSVITLAVLVARGGGVPAGSPTTVSVAGATVTRAPSLPTQKSIVITVTPVPPTTTPTETATPRSGETRIFTDGAPMVYVPAGEFTMGSDSGFKDNKPSHTIYLDAFWIDMYETTNSLYKHCVDMQACQQPRSTGSLTRKSYYGNFQFENYPVIYVSWYDAKAYCDWAGERLPTEAEWEKAASWDESTKTKRTFTWGNTFDQNRVNFSDSTVFCGHLR